MYGVMLSKKSSKISNMFLLQKIFLFLMDILHTGTNLQKCVGGRLFVLKVLCVCVCAIRAGLFMGALLTAKSPLGTLLRYLMKNLKSLFQSFPRKAYSTSTTREPTALYNAFLCIKLSARRLRSAQFSLQHISTVPLLKCCKTVPWCCWPPKLLLCFPHSLHSGCVISHRTIFK